MSEALRVVSARREHFDAFARLFPELGTGDALPAIDVWSAHIAPDIALLELDGEFVAYVWAQAPGESGYVRHVVVDPRHRRRGLGRETMTVAAARLVARGCRSWELNVKKDNVAAIALYRSLGMRERYDTWVVRFKPEIASALARSENELRVRAVDAEHDASLARTFEVASGTLEFLRKKPDTCVLVAESNGQCVGLAPFDASYPGCFPFRARDAGAARALIEALALRLPSGASELQLVIERDEPVARALIAAGASLKFEITHMDGELPR